MNGAALPAMAGAIALVAAAGLGGVRLGRIGRSPGETAAWSWGLGTLMVTVLYVLLLAAGAQPGPKKLGLVLVIAAVPGLLLRRRRAMRAAPRDGIAVLFGAIAAAGCVAYALEAVAEPLWSTDFLALWGWKAKTIFLTGGIPGRLFHDPAAAWAHPEYPLFVPLAMAAFSALLRAWNDETLGLLYAAWQVATVLAVWGYCRRRAGPRAAAIASAVVAWFHPLYRGFGAGLADVPFAFAAVLLAIAAAERDVAAAAIAALLAAATKQEGLVLAAIVAVLLVAVASEDRSGARRTAAAIGIAAAGHAAVLLALRGPLSNRDFTFAPLFHPADLAARIARLLPGLAAEVPLALLVGLAATAGILFAGRRTRGDFLLAALALQIAAYLCACVFSAWDPVWQLQGFFRTSSALGPAAAMLLAARFPASGAVSRVADP